MFKEPMILLTLLYHLPTISQTHTTHSVPQTSDDLLMPKIKIRLASGGTTIASIALGGRCTVGLCEPVSSRIGHTCRQPGLQGKLLCRGLPFGGFLLLHWRLFQNDMWSLKKQSLTFLGEKDSQHILDSVLNLNKIVTFYITDQLNKNNKQLRGNEMKNV